MSSKIVDSIIDNTIKAIFIILAGFALRFLNDSSFFNIFISSDTKESLNKPTVSTDANEQNKKAEQLLKELEQERKRLEQERQEQEREKHKFIHTPTIQNPIDTSFKPSFPCEKASTDSEYTICSNAELASIDVEMSDIYKTLYKNTIDKKSLKYEQNKWRANYRDICRTDVVCILNSYTVRIKQLKENYR